MRQIFTILLKLPAGATLMIPRVSLAGLCADAVAHIRPHERAPLLHGCRIRVVSEVNSRRIHAYAAAQECERRSVEGRASTSWIC